jgi:hypothetical protein
MASSTRALIGLAALAAVSSGLIRVVPAGAAPRQPVSELNWQAFKDSRLGYLFTFPSKVFKTEAGDPTEPLKAKTQKRSGQVFRSADGKAFLQTAAFANFEKVSITEYKNKVAASYKGARIEYERLGPNFFVLSGVRGKETFYERVYFTCGGRVISAWSMNYPQAEGSLYDRIVEEFSRSYRPAETPQTCA